MDGGNAVRLKSIIHAFKKFKLIDTITSANLSIRNKIIIAFIIVILLMGILNIAMLYSSLKYSEQYNTVVLNITNANSINGIVKTRIDSEMWDIVKGKVKFEEGKQYEIIREINTNIKNIMKNVSNPDNRTRLDVTLRTMKTLTSYVDTMGQQIRDKRRVAENEKVLEEIRGVSSLVEENIQEFILYELQDSAEINTKIQNNIKSWVLTNIIVLGLVFVFSGFAAWVIGESISKPIRVLHKMTKSISEGNLDVRVENKNVDEITSLGRSFNIMTQKIKELFEKSIKEQEELKKAELKVMQAQINPHFLYNTLDTIIWMAEANKSEQVIEIVRALSNFFRITLSKGNDWITIRDEVAHIRSYLIIQKIRYRDILDFDIDIDEKIMDYTILKLTLQPIVENALYHGIKNKRKGGVITISGYKTEDGKIVFKINDNGAGMTEERYKEVQAELEDDSKEMVIKDRGFGLSNVHKRIKLYYGEQYGLSISTENEIGTEVSVVIPIRGELGV